MKRLLTTALFSCALLLGAQDASAQTSIGANIGYNFEYDETFLGGQLRFAPSNFPLVINPSVETYFADNATWLRFDINGLYMFGVDNAMFTPYSGAGLGLDYYNHEDLDSETNAMLNLVFGANFGMAQFTPFAEARVGIGDVTEASVRGGILIGL